jgi:hypothetical protein
VIGLKIADWTVDKAGDFLEEILAAVNPCFRRLAPGREDEREGRHDRAFPRGPARERGEDSDSAGAERWVR